jgi:cobalamin biosynthesis protein CbiG
MVGQQAMSRSVAIGVGCRIGCQAEAIEALVRQALEAVPDAVPRGLFTIEDKAGEAGLTEAAGRLRLDLVLLPRAALRDQAAHVATPSPGSMGRFGVPSVAESAALAGCGPDGVLLVRRMTRDGASCAIAGAKESAA